MNELKPEDVMRALECCSKNYACHKCPYSGKHCGKSMAKDAIALLREKDARIEELELKIAGIMWFVDKWLDGAELEQDEVKRADTMREKTLRIVEEKDAEIERLTAYNANLLCANTDITNRHKDYVEEAERIARRDTITEFAERLKKFYSHLKGNTVGGSVEYHIDQIVKEMKGEHNNGNQNQT